MSKVITVCVVMLLIYSVVLVGVEWNTSQDYVRHFVTDIEGPVPFYAVNTTISVYLLWTTALLFAICMFCSRGITAERRLFQFFLSQVFIFALLGADDRFKLHEHIAWRLGIGDHFVLLAVAAAEMLFLIFLGGAQLLSPWKLGSLFLAGFLFAVMLVFDALVPHDMVLRLSLEDLAKTWACFCFLLFGWQFCHERIDLLRASHLRESTRMVTT